MQPWPMLARLWQMIIHTKDVFLSPTTPLPVKIVLALGLLYTLSPYDLIPEWVPVFGVMDDLALAALLIAWANSFEVPK
ncbi:YkvA family protein [Desulfobulbus elongatus]|uniref:YkvA family protein n=1 Tax=Desulfobulbus elongatus TaxID=53332 RepID=UPI000B024CA6|nr:YkvA family protein [Desulfobulbus elongatus]